MLPPRFRAFLSRSAFARALGSCTASSHSVVGRPFRIMEASPRQPSPRAASDKENQAAGEAAVCPACMPASPAAAAASPGTSGGSARKREEPETSPLGGSGNARERRTPAKRHRAHDSPAGAACGGSCSPDMELGGHPEEGQQQPQQAEQEEAEPCCEEARQQVALLMSPNSRRGEAGSTYEVRDAGSWAVLPAPPPTSGRLSPSSVFCCHPTLQAGQAAEDSGDGPASRQGPSPPPPAPPPPDWWCDRGLALRERPPDADTVSCMPGEMRMVMRRHRSSISLPCHIPALSAGSLFAPARPPAAGPSL